MAMVIYSYGGLGGEGMEVVGMLDRARGVGRMLEDDGSLPECEVKTLMTPDHPVFRVCSSVGLSWNWSVFCGRPQHGMP